MIFKEKTFVVTGAGNGLGRELSLDLMRCGAHVVGVDIRKEYLEETAKLAEDTQGQFSSYVVDISNKKAVDAFAKQVRSDHGAIDGLINNAGIIQPFVPVEKLDFDTIDRVMGINFYGMLYMVKAFLPGILKKKEASIVNVSSMGGFFPFPGQTVYGASKAANKLFTEGLYMETINANVGVMSVLIGAMDTDIMKNSGAKMTAKMKEMQGSASAMSPKTVSQKILQAMEKDKSKLLVGKDAKMMDVLYRIAPQISTKLFAKYMGKKILG